jgi:hypothetical protein
MNSNVFDDPAYRALTTSLLGTASDSFEIEVVDVRYERGGYSDSYSWLCFVVDPNADDRVASTSGSSAADHFAIINPNGFLKNVGSQLRLAVFELEVSYQAPIWVRGEDGSNTLTSPWVANLAVAKALFNYTVA